ncbi:MAG: LamG domain-containing protein [Planctomycetes bacterium]|nr:LamG domain-containing protein [Planctomycetota bacterium]
MHSDRTASLPPGVVLSPGVRGNALYLPARSEGVRLSLELFAGRTVRAPVTVTGWFKVQGVEFDLFHAITTKGDDVLRVWVESGRVWVRLKTSDPAKSSDEFFSTISDIVPTDKAWHHVAFVWSAEKNESVLYVDGKKRDSFRGAVPPVPHELKLVETGVPALKMPLQLIDFRYPDLPIAAIDELCVFDRALTNSEVRSLAGVSSEPE